MKLTTLVLSLFVFLILGAQSAVADRYLITYKNPRNFSSVTAQLPLGVKVSEQLVHIGSAVVDVNSAEQLARMEKMSGLVHIEKEVFHPLPLPVNGFKLTPSWDFSLRYSLTDANREALAPAKKNIPWGIVTVKAHEAWTVSKKGEGIRVVVLDTGIDHDHPALKDNFEKGENFVNDMNAPYAYADHVGHGTHVAGTIAAGEAADGFTGVAPKAKILAGRVCSDEGCSNIAVAKGINWAIAEKADVVNLSLGGFFSTPGEREAILAAEEAGVVIVAASGNDGNAKVSFPAALPTAFAVGAISSDLKKADFSQFGPELDIVAPGVDVVSAVPMGSGRESQVAIVTAEGSKDVVSNSFAGSSVEETELTKEFVFVNLGKADDFAGKDLSGKFALIKRGEITFADKVKNALAASAAGVVIFNHEAGLIQGAVTEDGSTLPIPVVMIEKTVGDKAVQLSNEGETVSFTIKIAKTDYAGFSGTSMASPHVAGVVALVKAANPAMTPAEIRDLLKATAEPLAPSAKNETGSGLVNAEKAVTEAAKLR